MPLVCVCGAVGNVVVSVSDALDVAVDSSVRDVVAAVVYVVGVC